MVISYLYIYAKFQTNNSTMFNIVPVHINFQAIAGTYHSPGTMPYMHPGATYNQVKHTTSQTSEPVHKGKIDAQPHRYKLLFSEIALWYFQKSFFHDPTFPKLHFPFQINSEVLEQPLLVLKMEYSHHPSLHPKASL